MLLVLASPTLRPISHTECVSPSCSAAHFLMRVRMRRCCSERSSSVASVSRTRSRSATLADGERPAAVYQNG